MAIMWSVLTKTWLSEVPEHYSFPEFQMLSMQLFCFSKQTPFSLSGKPNLLAFKQYSDDIFHKRISSSSSHVVLAVKEDSQQYEVDPDKAREALQNLDQQLQSLSKKQVPSPKIRGNLSLSLSCKLQLPLDCDKQK